MTPEKDLREQLATCTRIFAMQGLIGLFGHVSVYQPETKTIFVTPGSGSDKPHFQADDMIPIHLEGKPLDGANDKVAVHAVCRENVFWADDDPVQRVTTYVPWEIAEGTGLLAEEVGHPYGIHGIFEDQGHVMTRIREEVSARMPRPEERRDLRLPPGVPVLDVLHTSLDQQGQPYELTRFVMRADLTGLLYDVPVE